MNSFFLRFIFFLLAAIILTCENINFDLQVIFPALDIRVKNVAQTYSLEHKGESNLFDHLFELLNSNTQNDESFPRELASCTGALKTSVSQHMAKEEEQVLFHGCPCLPSTLYANLWSLISSILQMQWLIAVNIIILLKKYMNFAHSTLKKQ